MWGDWPEKLRSQASETVAVQETVLPKGAERRVLCALWREYKRRWATGPALSFQSHRLSLLEPQFGVNQLRPFSVAPFETTPWGLLSAWDYAWRALNRNKDKKKLRVPSHVERPHEPYDPQNDERLLQVLTLRARGLLMKAFRAALRLEKGDPLSRPRQSQVLRTLADLDLVWYSSKGITEKQRQRIQENERAPEGKRKATSEVWETQNPDRVKLLALGYVVAEKLFNI